MPTNAQPPAPAKILEFHREMIAALDSAKQMAIVSPGESIYFGVTAAELEARIAALRAELDQQVVLLLVASFEAQIQLDFQNRIKSRAKDPITRNYRKTIAYDKNHRIRDRVELDRILDACKKEVKGAAIGNFLQLVNYRHWLAHGRYWIQKSGLKGQVQPIDAWQRGSEVLRAMGIAMPGTS